MGIFDIFKKPSPEALARQAAHQQRVADITAFIADLTVPPPIRARLEGARAPENCPGWRP